MKKSKVINIEDESLSESEDSIEIFKKPKQKIIMEEEIIDKPKPKREKTQAQIDAWNKALKIREEKRLQRKQEKEAAEQEQKQKLEEKILLKAKRIKKAQTKILGDDIDDEIIDKPKKVKKKVIIYKSDSSSEEEEVIVKKYKPKNKEVKQSIVKQHLTDNNNFIERPTYRKVIHFVCSVKFVTRSINSVLFNLDIPLTSFLCKKSFKLSLVVLESANNLVRSFIAAIFLLIVLVPNSFVNGNDPPRLLYSSYAFSLFNFVCSFTILFASVGFVAIGLASSTDIGSSSTFLATGNRSFSSFFSSSDTFTDGANAFSL